MFNNMIRRIKMGHQKVDLMLDKSNLKEVPFITLQGKTIKDIIISEEKDHITFICDNNEKYLFAHDQDCCEDVYLESIDNDINLLLNSPILIAEETKHTNTKKYLKDFGETIDTQTWSFYKLGTINGVCVFRWYGSGGGEIYSESASLFKIKD